jgi:hypothetical protein
VNGGFAIRIHGVCVSEMAEDPGCAFDGDGAEVLQDCIEKDKNTARNGNSRENRNQKTINNKRKTREGQVYP